MNKNKKKKKPVTKGKKDIQSVHKAFVDFFGSDDRTKIDQALYR